MNAASGHKPEPVARLYAKALYELALENNGVDAVQADLAGLLETLKETGELRQALVGYALSVEAREKLFAELSQKVQLNPIVTRLGSLLISKNRFGIIDSVYVALRDLIDESKNTLRGTVTTVEPLSEAEINDLSRAFSKKFDKNVVLDSAINKELLGGLVVQIQGLTFDGSLKTTIRRLKENLERQSI